MIKDMTENPIILQLIKFTIPLIRGTLFWLTYNASDSGYLVYQRNVYGAVS